MDQSEAQRIEQSIEQTAIHPMLKSPKITPQQRGYYQTLDAIHAEAVRMLQRGK